MLHLRTYSFLMGWEKYAASEQGRTQGGGGGPPWDLKTLYFQGFFVKLRDLHL